MPCIKDASIVSAYAFTMTNPDEVKDKFYNDLDDFISATPRTDKIVLLGDFNVGVGTDHQTWGRRCWKVQQQWSLASKEVSLHDLLMNKTVFRLPNRNKTFLEHPRSTHWHLHVINLFSEDQKDNWTVFHKTVHSSAATL